MNLDTDRLITIANDLKSLDTRRGELLAELARLAQGGGSVSIAPRGRGRPPGSSNKPKPAAPAPASAPASAPGRRRRRGLTTDIVEFLSRGGGAHTAGEIVEALKRPKTKSGISTVSTTLVRLVRAGRVKKDKERGYRAA